uniref:MAT1-1-5 n=1 Tax=Monilinia fructigena TaxID=38457 RepID=A0A2U8RNQ2_9HELO|nr:MAT1-1-5 [Monilinia fructigena]
MKIKTGHQIRHEAFIKRKHLWNLKYIRARIPLHPPRTLKCHDIHTFDPSTFSDATLAEITAALERDGLLTSVPLEYERVSSTYELFNPGIEATPNSPGKPCEPAFLEALVRDCCILIWKFRGLYRHTDFNSMDEPLPTEYAEIFYDLNAVFDQCRRLKKSPELFSTLVQERQFMKNMSRIAEIVDHLRDIIIWKNESKLARNAMREKEKELSKGLPLLHPGRADGKHPWSRWLENSSSMMPRDWIGIQQKIPHIGDNIIRRITTMYELYERQFRIEGLIDRKVNDNLIDFPAPGEPFEHMAYSQFATIGFNPANYKVGYRSNTDKNGVIRIEELAKAVQESYGKQENPVIAGNENAPYHRIMMGFDIDTLYYLYST